MGWSSKHQVLEAGRGTNSQEWGLFPIQGNTLDGRMQQKGKRRPRSRAGAAHRSQELVEPLCQPTWTHPSPKEVESQSREEAVGCHAQSP